MKHVGHPVSPGAISIAYHYFSDDMNDWTQRSMEDSGLLAGGSTGNRKVNVYMCANIQEAHDSSFNMEHMEDNLRLQVATGEGRGVAVSYLFQGRRLRKNNKCAIVCVQTAMDYKMRFSQTSCGIILGGVGQNVPSDASSISF